MQIQVSGRHISIGDAFKTHCEDRLNDIADKYFSRSIEAHVTVVKEAHFYRADVSLHPNQGMVLKARGEGEDVYGAFEGAADKVEKQLRRYKRRLKDHHSIRLEKVSPAQTYVIADDDPDQASGDDAAADASPMIIAETRTEIPKVSVSDAVMLMNLADASAYMFRNVKSDALNVVYRRPDGHIGWIEPGANEAS